MPISLEYVIGINADIAFCAAASTACVDGKTTFAREQNAGSYLSFCVWSNQEDEKRGCRR